MSASEIYRQTIEGLSASYEPGEAAAVARILLEDVFGLSFPFTKEVVSVEQMDQWRDCLKRLQSGEPVQYIAGKALFLGRYFEVNPEVLIPRQETEELVDWILEKTPGKPDLQILDIGTGSGCIAVSLALALEKYQPQVHAWDVSPGALATAAGNAATLHASIQTAQLDILDDAAWPEQQWDIIVSNPPYIPPKEKHLMPARVLDHEPGLALFAPNDDPLLFYRTIATFAARYLKPGGYLFFEINEFYARELLALLQSFPLQDITLQRDLSGSYRMLSAQK